MVQEGQRQENYPAPILPHLKSAPRDVDAQHFWASFICTGSVGSLWLQRSPQQLRAWSGNHQWTRALYHACDCNQNWSQMGLVAPRAVLQAAAYAPNVSLSPSWGQYVSWTGLGRHGVGVLGTPVQRCRDGASEQ